MISKGKNLKYKPFIKFIERVWVSLRPFTNLTRRGTDFMFFTWQTPSLQALVYLGFIALRKLRLNLAKNRITI